MSPDGGWLRGIPRFVVHRRDPAECGMAPARVVPAFDVREQGKARLGFGLEASTVDKLALETREEARRDRVVGGVAHAAHRGPNTELGAALAEGNTGVLRTLIAVVDYIA